jgi:hypothetical protein
MQLECRRVIRGHPHIFAQAFVLFDKGQFFTIPHDNLSYARTHLRIQGWYAVPDHPVIFSSGAACTHYCLWGEVVGGKSGDVNGRKCHVILEDGARSE